MSGQHLDEAEKPADTELVAIAPGLFAFTDLGNAERFVARCRAKVRYSPQRRRWLVWDEQRWAWDERGQITQLAKDTVRGILAEAAACRDDKQRAAIISHARSSEKVGRIQALLTLAQSEPPLPVLVSEIDADPYLLNCPNGTIDLRTGKLRGHQRSDLITKSTGVDFDGNARSELWERVLHDATGGDGDLAAYLQRVVGYSLIGEPLERAFFFLYGPPGTAKSTLIEAFHGALGDYASAAAFETWLVQSSTGGNRGDLVRLTGARLVVSVEVRHGARWDEALVKAVTGGDEITAAAKYESEISFRPSFTLMLAANDSPTAREDDAGLWARLRRIPLTAQIAIERQDPSIKAKLREHAHAMAVLAWAVAGCLAYQRDGLGTCSAVEESTAAYRAENDHFSEFLADCCVFETGLRTTRKALRDKYESWAKETGRRSLLSARDIAAKLKSRGAEERMVKGTREWFGLGFQDPAGEQNGYQGADGSSVPQESSSILSLVEGSGNGAPKCSPLLPASEQEELW